MMTNAAPCTFSETAAKASARAVGVAATRTARAQARLEEVDTQLQV